MGAVAAYFIIGYIGTIIFGYSPSKEYDLHVFMVMGWPFILVISIIQIVCEVIIDCCNRVNFSELYSAVWNKISRTSVD